MDDIDRAVTALAALAHADRLRAFRALVRAGPEGIASGRLARLLDLPPTRMSFHLAALERAGLVGRRREGRSIRYAVAIPAMRDLLGYLAAECCGGQPELCAGLPVPQNACNRKDSAA